MRTVEDAADAPLPSPLVLGGAAVERATGGVMGGTTTAAATGPLVGSLEGTPEGSRRVGTRDGRGAGCWAARLGMLLAVTVL